MNRRRLVEMSASEPGSGDEKMEKKQAREQLTSDNGQEGADHSGLTLAYDMDLSMVRALELQQTVDLVLYRSVFREMKK